MGEESEDLIAADSDVQHGKPVIKGTRVPVDVVLRSLADGASVDTICVEYGLDEEQVQAALRYAASVVAGEEFKGIEA